jgi:Ca2+-transporting ATPase
VEVTPFDPQRKRMTVYRADGRLYVKGAVEVILPLCVHGTSGASDAALAMANRGLRVLAVAAGDGPEEANLSLLGLVGIADPPRPEIRAAIAAAYRAGIRVVMITGDHAATAEAIARELGIRAGGDDDPPSVHARVAPHDKLMIVRRWKADGAIVAMTGDGVNDAPALREAHIGIAMGQSGTEVTREAADLVLADDDFASIIAAVGEGRGTFDNIRKTLGYLLGGNAGELAVMLVAALAGLPLPFLPVHLLWINIVTDGLPALALVMDPPDADVLDRPPRDPRELLLGRRQWVSIAVNGALQCGTALLVFSGALRAGLELGAARTLAFTTLTFGELFRAFAARSATRIFWRVGALTNVRLLAVVVASVAVQIAVGVAPSSRAVLHLWPLTMAQWSLTFVLGLLPVTVLELAKLARAFAASRGRTPSARNAR